MITRPLCSFSTKPEDSAQNKQMASKFYTEELKAVNRFDIYSEKPVPFVNKVFKNPYSTSDSNSLSSLHPAKPIKNPKRKMTPQSSALFKEYSKRERHQQNSYFQLMRRFYGRSAQARKYLSKRKLK